ncbi:MAG: T9SS type A sorting domain-containing protein [Bacteroidota bacterium]
MKRILLFAVAVAMVSMASAQIVLDFESAATSNTFLYFANGSIPDNEVPAIIANPDQSGLNTSDSVTQFDRGVNAATFAGCATDSGAVTLDLTGANVGRDVCLTVWMPTANNNVRLKLEGSTTTTGTWEQEVTTTAAQTWEEICFTTTTADLAGGTNTASGNSWDKIVLFFEFGLENATDTSTYFFDNLSIGSPTNIDRDQIRKDMFFAVHNVMDQNFDLIFNPTLAGDKEVTVLNLAGQTVFERTIPAGITNVQIESASLASGMYIVNVKAGQNVASQKLMK